jgi:hypothetical protein
LRHGDGHAPTDRETEDGKVLYQAKLDDNEAD